jgi:hypothetical protein
MPATAPICRAARALVIGTLAGMVAAGAAIAAEPLYPIGARVGLVPPGGMQVSSSIRGFEDKDTQAMMLVLEMPASAYPDVEKSLTPESILKQGLIADKREAMTLANGKGVLIAGRQESEGKKVRKWIFLATLPEVTTLIAVQVPEAALKLYTDDAVRSALATVNVRTTVPVDEQLKLVPIVFDDLSGLRPFRVVPPNLVFLTEGPKDTMEAAEQPILAVSIGSGGPEKMPDRDNFARNLLSGMAEFKDVRIVSRDMLRLGMIPMHEIQAEAKDAKTDQPMKFVQWVRFGSGGFVRMVGISRAEAWRDAFPRFRAVRDGIRPPG